MKFVVGDIVIASTVHSGTWMIGRVANVAEFGDGVRDWLKIVGSNGQHANFTSSSCKLFTVTDFREQVTSARLVRRHRESKTA